MFTPYLVFDKCLLNAPEENDYLYGTNELLLYCIIILYYRFIILYIYRPNYLSK